MDSTSGTNSSADAGLGAGRGQALAAGGRQLPSFNGWRAVSILLVLVYHSACTRGGPAAYHTFMLRVVDGNLGVRFFFTISGFLITWLMLKEEGRCGRMSLRNFYVRRALRILPVYLGCVAAMAILHMARIAPQKELVWLQLLTFTRNFCQTTQPESPVSAHFWSLSVEEQFYLLWPAIFLGLARSPRKRFGFLCGVVVFSIAAKLVALLGCYNRHLYFLFQQFSTLLYLDCLAYGCAGAILLDSREAAARKWFERFSPVIFSIACCLILVPEVAGLGKGMQSFGFIFLLLQSVLLPELPPFKLLNSRWMVRIGVLSYSLYVWQEPIFLLWPFPKVWVLAFPMTFIAGWLSYEFLERPFFALRSRFRGTDGAPELIPLGPDLKPDHLRPSTAH